MRDVRSTTVSPETAEAIAVSALGFVASEPELLSRFLAITGVDPGQIRAVAGQPGFLAGVLQFILAHEPTLEAFVAASGQRPEDVGAALRALPFGDDSFDRST
jgi:hypothetical protein